MVATTTAAAAIVKIQRERERESGKRKPVKVIQREADGRKSMCNTSGVAWKTERERKL